MSKNNESVTLNDNESREGFASNMGFILASMGGAIGLGNIWMFPYRTGRYGGAAFIVVYLIVLVLIGIPVLMTEFAIGRKTQSSYTTALKKLLPDTKWYLLGRVGVINLIITLSFYGVVAGWVTAYIFKSVTGAYKGLSAEQIGMQFGQFISSPITVFWFAIILAITAYIVVKGIEKGIEKVSNILLPVLFIMIIFLGIRAMMLPGAGAGVEFYLKPDFSLINGESIMAAISQVFFSLGVGCGNLVVYGSYLDKKNTLTKNTLLVGIGDTAAAILFGFIIFPAAFAYGIQPDAGPPLIFITLPTVFSQMTFGLAFGTLFFALVFMACITSTICILEGVVGYGMDELKWTRQKSTIIFTVIIFVLGTILAASYGPLSNILIMGKNLFDFSNEILVSTIILPLGGLLMMILVGWVLKPKTLLDEINTGSGIKVNKYYVLTTRYIASIALTVMFLQSMGILKF